MLTFDPEAHVYHFAGARVPGVTEVIASAGLVNGTDWFTPEARIRGRAVHRACELDDALALDEATVDDVVRPYLDAWRRFRLEAEIEVLANEKRVYGEIWRYAGTLDRIAMMKVGRWRKRAFLDIKTGQPQRATGVQLAAYAMAESDIEAKRFGVYLHPDGRYALVEYNDPTDRSTFLAALQIHNWKGKA